MAHNHTAGSPYSRLQERLDRFPQGAPASHLLFDILKILMNEKEAALMAQMPIKPFNVKQAAEIWKLSECESQKVLDELASRALLVDMEQNGEQVYAVPPPMAGFFEFSLMRVRDDIDQKALSELFYQYITVEEDFMRDLVCNGDVQLGRIFVKEPQIPDEYLLQVLDYERATNVIETASHIIITWAADEPAAREVVGHNYPQEPPLRMPFRQRFRGPIWNRLTSASGPWPTTLVLGRTAIARRPGCWLTLPVGRSPVGRR